MKAIFNLTIQTGTWEVKFNENIKYYIYEYKLVNVEKRKFVFETELLFNEDEYILIPDLNESFKIGSITRHVNGDTEYSLFTKYADTNSKYDIKEECDKLNSELRNKRKQVENSKKDNKNKSWFSRLFG